MVFEVSKTGIGLMLFVLLWTGPAGARTSFYSFFSDEPGKYLGAIERYERAARSGACPEQGAEVRGGIVTHHLLAIDLMTELFECLSRRVTPERIVLIGPDHYAQTRAGMAIARLPWKTPFGELAVDAPLAGTIQESLGLTDDPEAFSGEHSIGVLVPFLRYYFPKSKVVPIIVQRNVGFDRLIGLKDVLSRLLDDPKTLILLSMDFSHNQTSGEADRRDERAKDVIERLDYGQTDALDIDCHPGLKILLAALQGHRDIHVRVLNHSNSAKITGRMDIPGVTSYYTVLFFQKGVTVLKGNGASSK